jgi:propionyl-CoA carboxylase beta chain
MLRLHELSCRQPEKPPVTPTNDPADRMDYSLDDTLVPDNANKPYDMKELLIVNVDDSDFFELQPDYAKNIIIGFGRIDGHPVGIVANQPLVLAGCLDIKSRSRPPASSLLRCLQHSGRHLRRRPASCRAPPGIRRHHQARRQAALRLCRMHVPKVTVITRKAYGGAHDVMSSKHLRGDVNLAWPSAEIAVMGPKGAPKSSSARKRTIRPSSPSAKPSTRKSSPTRSWRCSRLHRRRHHAAATRKRIARSLAMLRSKKLDNPWRKHGNIPL